MRAALRLLGCAALLAAIPGPTTARASFELFTGTDFGAGPTDPRPNSDAAAASFDAAAAARGPVATVTFEGAPLGEPSADATPLDVGDGVTIRTFNADHNPPSSYHFGVTTGLADPLIDGYNTTKGGSNYFALVPQVNIGGASMTFNLATPTHFLGFYLTGLGTANGNLFLGLDDGTIIPISGSEQGGVQFFGLVSTETPIREFALVLQNVTGTTRDIFGVDDLRVEAVPEPSSASLLALGALALAVGRRARGAPRLGTVRHG